MGVTTGRRGSLARYALVCIVAAVTVLMAPIGGASPGGSPSATPSAAAPPQFIQIPLIGVIPSSGAAQSYVTVNGTNFPPNTYVNLSIASVDSPALNITFGANPAYPTYYEAAAVNATGQFSFTNFYVPEVNPGVYSFSASDGGTGASSTYGVTSSGLAFSVSPASAAPGATVTLTGSGFYPDDYDSLFIGNLTTYSSLGSAPTNLAGNLSANVTVPNLTPGTYEIVSDGDTYGYGGAAFTILPPPPTVALDPSSGALGSTITANGTGFTPSGSVDLTATPSNGATVNLCAPITATGIGTFSCTFTGPTASGATWENITAFDVTTALSGYANFSVLAPSITLSPEDGQPGTFESVRGLGLPPMSGVTVTFGTTAGGCATTTSGNGSFSCSFLIPFATGLSQLVTAVVSGTPEASAFFTLHALPSSVLPTYLLRVGTLGKGHAAPTHIDSIYGFLIDRFNVSQPFGSTGVNVTVSLPLESAATALETLTQPSLYLYEFAVSNVTERGNTVETLVNSTLQAHCQGLDGGVRYYGCAVSAWALTGGAGHPAELTVTWITGGYRHTTTPGATFGHSLISYPAYLLSPKAVSSLDVGPVQIGQYNGALVQNFTLVLQATTGVYGSFTASYDVGNFSGFGYVAGGSGRGFVLTELDAASGHYVLRVVMSEQLGYPLISTWLVGEAGSLPLGNVLEEFNSYSESF